MLTPFIVNLEGLDSSTTTRVFDTMERWGYTGANIKPGTKHAYMFYDGRIPVDELSKLLSIDRARITDATDWDIDWWLHH